MRRASIDVRASVCLSSSTNCGNSVSFIAASTSCPVTVLRFACCATSLAMAVM